MSIGGESMTRRECQSCGTGDHVIAVPARDMTGAAFFRLLYPKPDPQREVDLAAALAEHHDAIHRTWAIPKLWDQITARDGLRAEYRAKVEEIERRYAGQLTEVHSDPLAHLEPKRRRA